MHNFGVELVQPVDFYQKNMRSAKYALMIISLSFVVFFFFEKLRGHKIHPIQYLFIGLGLVLFYLLLVSLSEMVGFGKAYLIATIATVGLITWYTNTIVDDTRSAAILTSVLGGLYTYIYFLLQLKDYALLTGSIGLFFILAGIMYLSKHVQWQAEDHTESSPQLTEKELI